MLAGRDEMVDLLIRGIPIEQGLKLGIFNARQFPILELIRGIPIEQGLKPGGNDYYWHLSWDSSEVFQ